VNEIIAKELKYDIGADMIKIGNTTYFVNISCKYTINLIIKKGTSTYTF